jgi:hypothetical protein
VAKLHLNPLHTGGEDADGRPGDEGVSLLLEPQDVTGNFVAAAGKVSVVVLDPQLEGTAARVARWDIDEAKVKNSLKTVATNRGIELHLQWSDKRPQNNRLRLYVRMELADGNKLQTDREIFVTLPGEISDRWTPRKGEDLARQPRTTLAEPKMVPETAVTTPRSEVIPQPPPREEKPAQPEPAIAEPAVPLAEPAAPMPSRANTRPKSKLIMPPPALGESP